MPTYFIAAETQLPSGDTAKTNAIVYGMTMPPENPEFIPALCGQIAKSHGWAVEKTFLTCVSLLGP